MDESKRLPFVVTMGSRKEVIGPFLTDRKAYLQEIVRPLQEKEETLGRLHDWQQEAIPKLRWSTGYENHCYRIHRHDWLTNSR
jgi:hypothetical protein